MAVSCQPYTPVVLYSQEDSLYSFLLEAECTNEKEMKMFSEINLPEEIGFTEIEISAHCYHIKLQRFVNINFK
jgi:hypothetical protein